MFKRVCAGLLICVAAMGSTGCVGLMFIGEDKCPDHSRPKLVKADLAKLAIKPDDISKSWFGNTETWTWYNRKNRWCGFVIGAIVLPLPLLLPVCDEYSRVTFEGEQMVSATNAEVRSSGFLVLMTSSSTGHAGTGKGFRCSGDRPFPS